MANNNSSKYFHWPNLEFFSKMNSFHDLQCIELKDFRWVRFDYFPLSSSHGRCGFRHSFSVNFVQHEIHILNFIALEFKSGQCFSNGIAIVHFKCLTNHSFWICVFFLLRFWLDQAILNDMLGPTAIYNNTKQFIWNSKWRFSNICISVIVCLLCE